MQLPRRVAARLGCRCALCLHCRTAHDCRHRRPTIRAIYRTKPPEVEQAQPSSDAYEDALLHFLSLPMMFLAQAEYQRAIRFPWLFAEFIEAVMHVERLVVGFALLAPPACGVEDLQAFLLPTWVFELLAVRTAG